MKWIVTTFVLVFSLSSTASWAQSKSKNHRPQHLNVEGSTKSGDNRKISLDDISVNGIAKKPLASTVTGNRISAGHDFVKIRLRWHDEMIRSATIIK